MTRFLAAALGQIGHLYQCPKCQAWTESPVCTVCTPN